MKSFFLSSALAVFLAGCSSTATQQFATNAAATVTAINTVNNALNQLDTTVINNTAKLARALAQINCPIINASVSLGKAVAADPAVAGSVKATLNKAGAAGALASDVCVAAGFGPNASAVPN